MEFKLKDVGKIITGKTPSTKESDNFSCTCDTYLFVTPKDMSKNEKYILKTERYLTNKVTQKMKNVILEGKSICVSCIGSDMGKVYMISKKAITNQQINSITNINEKICIPEYLYYYFKDKKEFLKGIAGGSTMPILNKSTFEELTIELPTILEQKKIVSIVDNIDMKIMFNNQINDNLQKYIKYLYKEKFIKNKNNSWNKYNLEDIADISNGYSYKGSELIEESNIGMATIKNFEIEGGFKEEGFKSINPFKAKKLHYCEKFDVLVACTDLTQNADIIGNTIMVLSKGKYEKILISMDLVKLIPKNNMNKFMLYTILNSNEFKNFAIGYTSGTTVLHLNKNCFKEFEIWLPEKSEIDKFTKFMEPIYIKMSEIFTENETLTKLRDTLLPKLMNGEIDLDKIEI